MLDARKAFAFLFEDFDWLPKLIVGTGLMLAAGAAFTALYTGLTLGALFFFKQVGQPSHVDEDVILFGIQIVAQLLGLAGYLLVSFFVWGYCTRLFRNVAARVELPLPAWNRWREDFVEGARAFAVALVYALPILLPALALVGWIVASGIDAAAAGHPLDVDDVVDAWDVPVLCGGPVVWLVYFALLPAPLMRFAATGRFREAFRLGAVVRGMRRAAGPYWLALVAGGIAATIGILGFMLCVGVSATLFFAQVVIVHAFAQVYRIGQDEGGG